jgi:leucyl aminopeptidase (aminopeptidase T)
LHDKMAKEMRQEMLSYNTNWCKYAYIACLWKWEMYVPLCL